MRMTTWLLILSSFVVCSAGAGARGAEPSDSTPPPAKAVSNANDSARKILERYADAWRGRKELPFDRDLVVAFWIEGGNGGEFHIVLPQERKATVVDGVPTQFDIGFKLDIDFLRRLDRGEMNALTAMGQARSNDPAPLVPQFGPQFDNIPDAPILFRRLSFHFWTKEWPEIVRFGEGTTREVHGGNAAVFYYDDKLRSAWYQIKEGMHINADADSQKNDYPQMVIVTRGQFAARLDGEDHVVRKGEMIFIPAGMTSEFWAEADQYGEFIWLGFGEGA